jgi:DNA-binding transcriptional LysR family regulator
MRHALPPLESLKAFESAARQLSFSRAAEELCITKGAISYQIRKLEEHLGKALFKRSVRRVLLTDAGQQLLQTTQRLFKDLADTLQRLQPGAGRYDVVIAATTYVAARWLSPRLATFSEQHPEVSIVLQHSVNSAVFSLEEVDIAIRWGRCDGRAQRHRLVELPMPLFPVCNPQVRARLGPRPTADALVHEPLLCDDRRQDLWQEWADFAGTRLHNPRRLIADANVRVQAAIDGLGLVLADELMRTEISSGALVAPFDSVLPGYGYVLMSAPSRPLNPGSRALRDWLVSH